MYSLQDLLTIANAHGFYAVIQNAAVHVQVECFHRDSQELSHETYIVTSVRGLRTVMGY